MLTTFKGKERRKTPDGTGVVQIKNTEPNIKTDTTILKEGLEHYLFDAKMAATAILEELPNVESKTLNKIYRRYNYTESISSKAAVTVLSLSFSVSFT